MVKDEHINKKIMVVSSTEKVIQSNYDFLPSSAFVPSVAGLLITSYIVREVIKC
jgi:tRNA A37 threonylcarbamoyladenosine dehydratase